MSLQYRLGTLHIDLVKIDVVSTFNIDFVKNRCYKDTFYIDYFRIDVESALKCTQFNINLLRTDVVMDLITLVMTKIDILTIIILVYFLLFGIDFCKNGCRVKHVDINFLKIEITIDNVNVNDFNIG